MNAERLPQKNLGWCPPGRRRKGRLRNSWMQEVTIGMTDGGELATWNGWTEKGGEQK